MLVLVLVEVGRAPHRLRRLRSGALRTQPHLAAQPPQARRRPSWVHTGFCTRRRTSCHRQSEDVARRSTRCVLRWAASAVRTPSTWINRPTPERSRRPTARPTARLRAAWGGRRALWTHRLFLWAGRLMQRLRASVTRARRCGARRRRKWRCPPHAGAGALRALRRTRLHSSARHSRRRPTVGMNRMERAAWRCCASCPPRAESPAPRRSWRIGGRVADRAEARRCGRRPCE